METLNLIVESREAGRKGAARALRRNGRIPAVVYGPKMEPSAISVEERSFEKAVGDGTRMQLLRLEGGVGDKLVLVKDTQRDPLTRALLHADLYEVDVEQKLHVEIPLSFVGKSIGVENGGILQPIRRSIEVLCLPLKIPDEIEIDVTELGIQDAVHVSDLNAPEGVEISFDTDFAVVTVLPPVVEEVKATEDEVEPGAEEVAAEGDAAAKKEEPEEG